MDECINREAAVDVVARWFKEINLNGDICIDGLRSLPAADVVERKTGKWIYPSDITGYGRCSECKALWDFSLITNKFFKVCPRCGSYNRGDDDV